MDEQVLSSSQAADYLGMTRQRIDQLGASGAIPRQRVGFFWVYSKSDLDQWEGKERSPQGRPRVGDEVKSEAPVLATI